MKCNYLLFLFPLFLFACSGTKELSVTSPEISRPIYNIQIDSSLFGIGACEPSIAVSPTDQNVMVAGSILNRVYQSVDGGRTWTKEYIKSSSGVYGDPVIEADYKGNFYYAHLSNPTGKAWIDEEFLDRIVVQKSTDNGATWNDGNYPAPNPPKDQDKEWLAIDPNDNTVWMCWTEFDDYGSKEEKDNSRILCSYLDKGEGDWMTPMIISKSEGDCLDGDQTTEGAVPAVGPDGEVYVTWAFDEKLYFDRTFDRGKTWLEIDKVIATQPGGWDIKIPGISRVNGFPVTKVDLSSSNHQGRIYVNWSDQRNGLNDTDIWIIHSDDRGDTWSQPKRVNDDLPGKHQFFTWMDVDPMTGYIYVVFYDRREYTNEETDVYIAYSTDGGSQFTNVKISDTSFKPNENVFFGDYNDISAYNGTVRPIWTRLDRMKLSVWTAIFDHK